MKYTEQFIKQNIGKIIKSERNKRGLTQEKLAIEISIEPKTLSKVETGKVFISSALLVKLSNFFEISPLIFFKFGTSAQCESDKDKLQAINEILSFSDSSTVDVVYKIVKALN